MKDKELMLHNGELTLEGYVSDLERKLKFCEIMLHSGFVPQSLKTPQAVLGAVLYGQEIGLTPIQSVQSIDIIQGRPTLSAQGIKALVLGRGGQIRTIEWTDKVCVLEFTRGKQNERVAFSLADAQAMQLTAKDNWRKMPKLMLYARCVSIGCRNLWADVLKGFYSKEEMEDSRSEKLTLAEMPQYAIVDQKAAVDTETGEIIEPLPEEASPPRYTDIDYSQFEYRYHLPLKKAGKDMKAVRESLKATKKFFFNGDDKCWYSNEYSEKLAEYIRPKPGQIIEEEFPWTPSAEMKSDD